MKRYRRTWNEKKISLSLLSASVVVVMCWISPSTAFPLLELRHSCSKLLGMLAAESSLQWVFLMGLSSAKESHPAQSHTSQRQTASYDWLRPGLYRPSPAPMCRVETIWRAILVPELPVQLGKASVISVTRLQFPPLPDSVFFTPFLIFTPKNTSCSFCLSVCFLENSITDTRYDTFLSQTTITSQFLRIIWKRGEQSSFQGIFPEQLQTTLHESQRRKIAL